MLSGHLEKIFSGTLMAPKKSGPSVTMIAIIGGEIDFMPAEKLSQWMNRFCRDKTVEHVL